MKDIQFLLLYTSIGACNSPRSSPDSVYNNSWKMMSKLPAANARSLAMVIDLYKLFIKLSRLIYCTYCDYGLELLYFESWISGSIYF